MTENHPHGPMGRMAGGSMPPFSMRRLGVSHHAHVGPMPSVCSSSFSMLCLTDGEVLVDAEGGNVLVRKGQLLFIPRGVRYTVRHFRQSIGFMGAFQLDFLSGDLLQADTCRRMRLLQLRSPMLFDIEESSQTDLCGYLNRMCDLSAGQSGRHDDLLRILLLAALLPLNERIDSERPPFVGRVSNRFLEAIFDDREPLQSERDYAQRFGITPNHLNKLVRNDTGRSVSSWIEESQILRSKRLLQHSDLHVAEVAERVGVYDSAYFSRKFRKLTGMTPLEYRKTIGKS